MNLQATFRKHIEKGAKRIYAIVLTILLTGTIFSFQIGDLPRGPHGGEVKQADDYYIESKKVYPQFYTFLLGKDYKSLSNEGISCEARFIFADSSCVDIKLKPFDKDGFESSSVPTGYVFCRIFYNVQGKIVSAGFESENIIVRKE